MRAKQTIHTKLMHGGRRMLTLLITLCMLISMVPEALAASSVGSSPSDLKASTEKKFIQVPASGASFFTGDTYGAGTVVTVPAGSVWMLLTDDYYTIDSVEYYAVYYQNKLHHVRRNDVNLLSAEEIQSYIEKNIWKAQSFSTLKITLKHKGDVHVYALQVALKKLGHYTKTPDGNYDQKTDDAVYRFQKSAGLTKDGDAGPITLKALYAKVTGSSDSDSSSSDSTSTPSASSALTESEIKSFVKVSSSGADFFTGETYGAGSVVKASKDSVWMLLTTQHYTVNSVDYYAVYYNNSLYHVRRSDVTVMSEKEITEYIEKNIWKATSFSVLKQSLNLKGDVRVYALQLALKKLGYFSQEPNGTYNQKTDDAVYKFQKAAGLTKDGDAGPLTQKALYEKVLEVSSGDAGDSGDSGSSGDTGDTGSTGSTGGVTVDAITAAKKKFIQIPAAGASVFTGKTSGTGTVETAAAGTVLMLVTDQTYTESSVKYYSLYYKNAEYHVRQSDVKLMTDEEVKDYLNKSVYAAKSFPTLKKSLNLKGSVNVYALELALKALGHFSGTPDGEYDQKTDDAVYSYQKAAGLTRDGDAGPLTQTALYAELLGQTPSTPPGSTGSTTTTATSGSLRTKVSVNLRQKASKDSAKLATVPVNQIMTYYNTFTSGGITWYQVVYNNEVGWLMGTYVDVIGSGTGTSTGMGTLTTIDSVNLRKSTSTSSTRLDVVPRNMTLVYYETKVSGGVTWYKVTYGVNTGWLMGTFVKATGGSGSSSDTGSSGIGDNYTVIGSLRITKTSTRVRTSPNGAKTGVVLAKGSTVSLIGEKVSSGGYDWYPVLTSSGLTGYVRSDCAQVVSNSGETGSVTVANAYQFVKLSADTPVYTAVSTAEAALTIPKDTYVRMVDMETVETDKKEKLCQIYYKGKAYYALYSSVSSGFLDDKALASLVLSLWNTDLKIRFENDDTLKGDVQVYAAQLGLYALGYYTGPLDGSYGNKTAAAVRNFQRAQKLEADGILGAETWKVLAKLAKQVSDGTTTVTPTTPVDPDDPGTTITEFGNVKKVTKPTWSQADQGNFWPKYTFATVLDVTTGKVFTIYRTGGSNHPDAVPYTTTDTKTMCEIVGFKYNSRRPTNEELKKIAADAVNSNSTYTWPDFKGTLTGVKPVGDAWDRRPALLNVNGNVYAVSIYGWPHGFEGIGANDGLSKQRFPNGKLLYENNNFYGCMCIRFYNSKGHSSANQTVIDEHNAACNKAYEYAKKKWPGLCK